MYQLYWGPDTGALAPHIVLEELQAEYQLRVVDMENAEETSAAYLEINPRGQVPALLLDDGLVITESAAILLHLADCHTDTLLVPPAGSPERARLYRWLFYAASNLYEGILRYYYSDRFTSEPAQAPQVQKAAKGFVDWSWSLLEDAIGEGPYFLGETYSVIDPYLLMLTNWHEKPEQLFSDNPKLARLCESVKSRPAVQRIWAQHFPQD